MSDLKPCPFCGGKPELMGGGKTSEEGACWWVRCHACGCLQGVRLLDDSGVEAIEAWNRRAQPAQAGQVLTEDQVAAMRSEHGWAKETIRAIESKILTRVTRMPQWLPIEAAPVGKEMFVVRAFNVQVTDRIHGYTSDAYGVWQPTLGRFERWPHPFDPTHWMPLPPPPGIVGEKGGQ